MQLALSCHSILLYLAVNLVRLDQPDTDIWAGVSVIVSCGDTRGKWAALTWDSATIDPNTSEGMQETQMQGKFDGVVVYPNL